ncbi:hypothetical protein [Acidithiobacillus ferridurans]|uniref:hypothetical protein n=1 Tax=Acidithiobacillus ferridurans TaxID=1232575 RepID=UPI0011BEC42B|nr:hypothetical protein [Acidithiobacillus ferridurans]
MSKPLKVYYCRDCGTRMPLYYKKEQPYRDDEWKYCISCKSRHLFYQKEVWDYKREQAANDALTREQKVAVQTSAVLWGKDQCGVSSDW